MKFCMNVECTLLCKMAKMRLFLFHDGRRLFQNSECKRIPFSICNQTVGSLKVLALKGDKS